MKEIKYRINLDVHQGGIQQTLAGFRAGDTLSRTVCVHLVERGTAYQVPADCTVTLYAEKPDGTVSYSMCTVENGFLHHTFTSGELAIPGEVLCEVRILSGDSNPVVLSSPQFSVIVEDTLQDDEAIESTNEYSALTQAIAGLEEKKEAAQAAAGRADSAAASADAAAQEADAAASGAMTAAAFANAAALEVRGQVANKPSAYVLLWSDNTQVDYREENEPVLQELCGLENGKYHVVLRDGNHEYPLLRREYTAADGYFYYFGGENHELYTAGEYVIGYKPAFSSLDAAEYTVTRRSTVNGLELVEYDFRPPSTDLVKMCMDEHTGDTDIHVTAAEKAKWNAGTGGASYGEATASASGLMSKADKIKLDGIEEGADSVSFESARTNGTKVGELTINGTPTTLWAPMNTHYLSSTVVGSSASAQSNGAAANGNVHWNHVEDTVVRSSHKLVGSGAAKVTADSSGNITVHATDTTYGNATASAAGLMSGTDKAKLDSVGKSYVLLWSDNTQVDYREENEPVLRELCGLENGKYHVVLRDGNHEYPMTRREYTAAKGYFYYFGGELSENYAAGEYVIGYKPGNSLEAAVYTVTGRSTVNGLELAENDFRPPSTDLVKLCMDEHTGDTDIHITAAERAAWNAGTGGVSYEEATTTASGLMSKEDKAKLDGITTNIKSGTNPGSVQGIMGCTASGSGAVALGQVCSASGGFSFALGSFANAASGSSLAMGYRVDASGQGQLAVGKYNKAYAGSTSANTTEGTQFIVGVGTSDSARANAFRVTTDGYCRGQNAFSGSGADYAEYFEWADGNPNGEDRRGYFVTLEGRKIRKATGADAYILGVISTTPAMIGNTYSDLWQGMYVTDIFGKRLTETVEVEAATDPDTGEEIPAHTETRFMLNPEYDPTQPYAGRHERPEWAAVGLVGQLVVIDDGTCTVNGYCKVTDSGTGTQSEERTAYRVMERLDADHIRIFLR